jgi:hypothetical protein
LPINNQYEYFQLACSSLFLLGDERWALDAKFPPSAFWRSINERPECG